MGARPGFEPRTSHIHVTQFTLQPVPDCGACIFTIRWNGTVLNMFHADFVDADDLQGRQRNLYASMSPLFNEKTATVR